MVGMVEIIGLQEIDIDEFRMIWGTANWEIMERREGVRMWLEIGDDERIVRNDK